MTSKEQLEARYRKWIDALRSGKYEQAFWRLRDEQGRCCALGVLIDTCEAIIRVDGEWISTIAPNESVLARAARETQLTGGYIWNITEMNDHKRKSLSEIADYIEETVLPQVLSVTP